MANYNSGLSYNQSVNYNSATYFIVEVSNAGHGTELISLLASLSASDSGIGVDAVGTPVEYPADSYFIITTEGRLEPLGVMVLRDSRHELMPGTRDNTEEIPGRHGEIDFGSEFKSRLLELHVATDDGLTPATKETLKRTIAKYLNPVAGTKKLIFQDDETVQYEVKYAGKIDLTKYTDWMEFTIPFKMTQLFIESVAENTLTGNGYIVNNGTFECPILIEIPGPATNPSISVGASVLAYTGYISAGALLIINTDVQTACISAVAPINAMAAITGDIDYVLTPGISVAVAPSISTAAISWRDRWL